ncbi:TNT domain-containing protein [uncultured Streptococcus sp.]|uniref:TNT domain-containing protein n=1 Tax=uncultured Streptococcus sp. TaxID=83427 RepID=UPI0028805A2F|nr:TNT domain-containing protein [uncultured Streptococcus sp.]
MADSVDYKAIAGKDDTVTTDSLAKKGKDDALKMADSKVDQSTTDALGAVDVTEKALESANAGTQKASTGSSRYNLAVSPEVETALDSLSEEHRNQFIKALKDYGYGLNNSETSATTTPEYTLSSTSSSNKGKLDFTPYGQSTLTDSQGQPTSAYQDLLDLANSKESQPLFNQSASNDYQIKKGDSLAKIGNLHYPDDKEKAAAASMLALQDLHGQNKLNINNKQNRINLTPGNKVNVDLSNYTSEEISALAKGFNKIQSAENKIDTFRQAQEEAKALARAQERQNRASQARKIWQEQPTNATSKLSDLLQQNTDSSSESKSQKIAKGWANLSAPTKPNRFGQPNYQAGYQEVKIRPTTLEEVRPGALSQFVNKYLLADPSASNKYLAETKVLPKDFSLDAFEKRSKISHEAGKAAFKEYYNDAVTGLASLADLSFDGMKTTAHKAGLVNLSKDELNEIYNRDSAVWQRIIDKWDSTSAPEMLLGVSRYVMNLASQVSPGSHEINSISNFIAGDGLAQKNQLKTTLEAAEFALPASKASIAGKIAKNGVGSAAHAIASKTGKALNKAEDFGKNLFDATKSKVDNFEQKGHQSALTEKVLNNIADSANARRASNFYPHIGKEKRIDTHRYDLWNRHVNKGLEPSDRAKLTQWSQLLEPEFYLENKKVFDNPDYFNQLTGNAIYPGTPESALGRVDGSIHKDGFLNGEYKESVILPGTRINRIGSNPTGRYFSPAGATFGEKALPPFMKLQPDSDYITLKKILIREGLVAPWFDEPGMGIQYYTYLPMRELEKGGYLHKIKKE